MTPSVEHISEKLAALDNGCSLVENYIDLIQPYHLNEVQAIGLFRQVQKDLEQSRRRNYPSNASHWALAPC